jgi:hypothetical protein
MTIYDALDDGNVKVRVIYDDVTREDSWTGTWRPATRAMVLTRELPDGLTQTYTGYLGDNDPSHLIFGGDFTQTDAGDTKFGWFAEWQYPLIF